ncbi:MAG: GcrA family cell cycle regulator [Devosia sp.]
MSWTDERIELLRKLWADGLSASQIAGTLGDVTRNAVIGKIHRLGLSGRVKAPSQTRTPRRPAPMRPKPAAAAPSQPRVMAVGNTVVKVVEREVVAPPPPVLEEAAVVPIHGGISLLDLSATSCRWPVGDPSEADFRFCGAKTGAGDVYCSAHADLAFPGRTRRPKPKLNS